LKKYEVDDCPEQLLPGEATAPQFDYDTSFAAELKQEVKAYFQKEAKRRGVSLLQATKCPPRHWGRRDLFDGTRDVHHVAVPAEVMLRRGGAAVRVLGHADIRVPRRLPLSP
jgi:hypothetical protein